MNVSMLLTLVDRASPAARAFMGVLTALEGVVNTVSQRISALQAVQNASATAATNAAVAHNRQAASLENLRAQSTSTAAAQQGHINVLGQLNAAVTATVGHLNQLMGAMGGVTAATNAMHAAGGGAGGGGLGTGLQGANNHANNLMQTLKGVAQLWGALEIKKGVVETAKEGVAYEVTQTRLKNMKVTPTEEREMIEKANQVAKEVPQFNRNETLEMGIDLRNATGSVEHALFMLKPFAEAAYNMKMATPEGKVFDMNSMLLIAKALEQRNATQDPVKMQAELDMFGKIYAATQGRVDANQILGNLQYAKGGLGQTLSLEFMPYFAAMIEQIKSQGGQGGAIGTMLTTLQSNMMGRGSIDALNARADAGLIAPPTRTRAGNVNRSQSNTEMIGMDMFQKNPWEWVQQYLKPAMIRAGIDLTNDTAVNRFLNKLFPDRQAAQPLSMMVTRGVLLDKDAQIVNQAGTHAEQRLNNIKTAQANVDAFRKQAEDLAIVMGTTLLPTIVAVTKWFTDLFQTMAHFFESHPVAAEVTLWAAAFFSLALAVSGMSAMFGLAVGPITAMLGAARGVLAIPGWLATIGAEVALFMSFILRAISVLGGLWLAWEAGFKIGGWIRGWMIEWDSEFVAGLDRLFTSLLMWGDRWVAGIQNIWTRGKVFFGMMSQDAGDAEIAANNAALAGRIRANADYGLGTGPTPNSRRKTGVVWSEEDMNYGNEGRFRNAALNNADYGNESRRRTAASLYPRSPKPAAVTGGGRGSRYNEDADIANQEYKTIESELKSQLASADSLYKQGLSAVEDYYINRQAALEAAVEKEQVALSAEYAAFKAKNDRAGMNRVGTQFARTEDRLVEGTAQNEAGRVQALKKLDDDALKIKRELMKSEGERWKAELTRIQTETTEKTKVLVLNGKITQEEADAYLVRVKNALDLTEIEKQRLNLKADYSTKQIALDAQAKNGMLSEREFEEQKLALMKEQAAQEMQMLLIAREKAANNPDELRKINTKIAETDAVLGQLPAEQIEIIKSLRSGLGDIFKDITSGSMSAWAAVRKFGQGVLDTFTSIISKRLGDELFNMLFGPLLGGTGAGASGGTNGGFAGGFGGGAGGGAGGGLLGGLIKMIPGAYSGAGRGGLGGELGSIWGGVSGSGWYSSMMASNTMAGTGGMTWADAFASGITPMATGTDYVPQDMLALVHEGEKITPKQYNTQQNAGPAKHYNITNNFAIPPTIDHRSQYQIVKAASQGIQRVTAR